MSDFAIADMDRRIANLIRIGTVASVDTASNPPTAVVDFDGETTQGLVFCATRAGQNRTWSPPDVGEQVAVFSPSGENNQGFILGAIYRDSHPANGNSLDVERTTYGDSTVVEYDRAAHRLTVDASASSGQVIVNVGGGSVTINCATATVNASDSVTLETPMVHCTQQLTVEGLITGHGGMQIDGGSGHTAAFSGNVQITGGEVTVDGIGVKSHHHTEHDGPSTSAAIA